MVGFGTALALPFGVLSFFPNVLSKLPKSGGWLQHVKVSLGFVELALALKFLSNADMVLETVVYFLASCPTAAAGFFFTPLSTLLTDEI